MIRRLLVFAVVALGSGAAVCATAAGTSGPGLPVAASRTPAPVEYRAPVPPPLHVVRGFDPPATPYGPGHLGVDLRARAGALVLAAADGVVRFAGPVAGRGLVVLLHPDGISTEYEPITPLVRAGQRVRRGQPVGRLAGRHRGCPGACVHWGAKRGGTYLDPLGLLRPLGPVRLLPWSRDG